MADGAEPHANLYPVVDNTKDYFIERDGMRYAGNHLLIEVWGGANFDQPDLIDEALCAGALAAGATILHSHFHHFSPYGGVSGVVVLAESHISIHTWPEKSYAAIDVFMCGDCDPKKTLPSIKKLFRPEDIEVSEHKRGVIK
ncbi:MAG: adenosylmethionine decarboxylase [Alphaproteobacteria bacterium]|nr:adenosylmethionine decarboxylase [Alphaproteobacteria bacterium]MBF0250860.1 adenosylmethionine decarboxylase [Alphaproteobacteria bacterium]